MKKLLPLLLFCAPSALAAQTSTTTLSSYVAADAGASGDPVLVGATLGKEVWRVGVRASAAVDVSSAAVPAGDAAAPKPVGRDWNADLDGLVYLKDPQGGASVIPYALVGAGVRAVPTAGGAERMATWSFGGGARIPLLYTVAMEAEARYRQPLIDDRARLPAEARSGIEVRFGLSLRMGGTRVGDVRAPLPTVRPVAGPARAPMGAVAGRALGMAGQLVGTPYRWGGNTPESGLDCSGFVRYVFAGQGIELPRVSRDQARVGAPLPLELGAFQAGDLLAFASRPGGEVDHIAIYAGDGLIIHSSSSGGGVRYDDLRSQRGSWYVNHLVAARRVLDQGLGMGAR